MIRFAVVLALMVSMVFALSHFQKEFTMMAIPEEHESKAKP